MQSDSAAQWNAVGTRQSPPFLRPIPHDALLKKPFAAQEQTYTAPVDSEFAGYTPNEPAKPILRTSARSAPASFDVDGMIKEILEAGASHISHSEQTPSEGASIPPQNEQSLQALADNIFPEQDEPVFLANETPSEPSPVSNPQPTRLNPDFLTPQTHETDLMTSLNLFWAATGSSSQQLNADDEEPMAEDAVPTASMATPMPVPTQIVYTQKKRHTGIWIVLALVLLLLLAVGVLWATDTLDDALAYPRLMLQRLTDQPAQTTVTSAPASITQAPKPTIDVGIDENDGAAEQLADPTPQPIPTHSPQPGGGSMNG